jgi:hypothetical protein
MEGVKADPGGFHHLDPDAIARQPRDAVLAHSDTPAH